MGSAPTLAALLLVGVAQAHAMAVISNTSVGTGSTVAVQGGAAYVAGADNGGTLYSIDVADTANPKIVTSTSICVGKQLGIAGVAAVSGSGSTTDVFVICPTALQAFSFEAGSTAPPSNPAHYAAVMGFSLAAAPQGLVLVGVERGINVLQLNGSHLTRLSSLPGATSGTAVTVSADAKVAYTAATKAVGIYNIADAASPALVANVSVPNLLAGNAVEAFQGGYVLVGGAGMCFGVVDVRDPSNPALKGTIAGDNGLSIAVHGTTAYVACTGSGSTLHKVDLSKPDAASITIVETLPFTNIIDGLAVSDAGLFVTTGGKLVVLSH
eukprot:TRINITY_DN10152_c0_g1_i1.p1 TRINITY_DN10152_c0_g1~~TRINITY_DN10152_c0_g1_i1.p1  ORF type:complete len:325 (+),score=127.20 TRINITY_DN10152_c0_g1_i1:61-1035(+)